MSIRIAATAVTAALLGLAAAAQAHGVNFTTNVNDDKPIITCEDIDMEFYRDRRHRDEYVTVRRDQSISLPALGATPLRVRASNHGHVRVQAAAAGAKASATVCFAAGADNSDEANAVLDKLRVVNTGGELYVTGPEDERWAAYLILSVPRDSKLDVSASNGGITLRSVSGRFTLRTTNGPIGITDVAGVVDCEAVNGPISYRGHEGDVRLTAQNGPVTVKLDAATWSGKGLEASTQNGPVQLVAPQDLKSGVLVQGSRHSPIQIEGTGQLHSDSWSREQSIRMGDGPLKIRLSTVNGPVQVKGPKGKPRPESIDI